MKSYGSLWTQIVSDENLMAAWCNFRRNHARHPATLKFQSNLEQNLAEIRRQLVEGTWEPSDYHQFRVYEPKPRTISAVKVPDRIVHHALCNICAPLMERRFIDQSYACRPGKGSHSAIMRVRELAKRHGYYLKIDVKSYFESVRHDILLGIFCRMFRERRVRELAGRIVTHPIPNHEPGRALPIGNLTSQWFANLYLDGCDHYAVEELGLGCRYIRYMDDMVMFFDTKAAAWSAHDAIRDWLLENRSLRLKDVATIVAPVSEGIPFLGIRVWRNCWRYRHSRLKRTRRSAGRYFKALNQGLCSGQKVQDVLRSMEGAANWFGFKGIFTSVESKWASGEPFRELLLASSAAAAPTLTMRSRGLAQAPAIGTTRRPTRTGTTASALPASVPGCKTPLAEGHRHKSHPNRPEPRKAGTNMQSGRPERVGANVHNASALAVILAAFAAFSPAFGENYIGLEAAEDTTVNGNLCAHSRPSARSSSMKSSCDVNSPRSTSSSASSISLSKNSFSLLRSVQDGAFGSRAMRLASSAAASVSSYGVSLRRRMDSLYSIMINSSYVDAGSVSHIDADCQPAAVAGRRALPLRRSRGDAPYRNNRM